MEFKIDHAELTEPVTFRSIKEVATWAQLELDFWATITQTHTNAAQTYVANAQNTLQRVIEAASQPAVDENKIDSLLRDAFAHLSILSTGPRGAVIASAKTFGHDPRAVGLILGGFLKFEELRNAANNLYLQFDTMVAASAVVAYESGGDPLRVVSLLNEIEGRRREWAGYIETLSAQTTRSEQANTAIVQELRESVTAAEKRAGGAVTKFESEIAEVRKKFEEEFALRTPMTYWSDKAGRHRTEARRYRNWFATLLIVGAVGLSAVGKWILFPHMATHPTAYWALILFSVAIAVWAWPLRITSKQYLVHQQLFEDAKEREVIAQTFLALNEQVKLDSEERKLLLGAIVRHAGVSLVSDDSGLNIADMVAMKTLTKP